MGNSFETPLASGGSSYSPTFPPSDPASVISAGDAYTSDNEIERLFSQVGVQLRIDDADAGTQSDIMDEIIDDATSIIRQYVWMNYQASDLKTSPWIRRRATYIAAHFLSQRRGNPAQFVDRFENIIQELQAVYKRELFIPDLNVIVQQSPTLSNHVIDNRGPGPVQRVSSYESIGTYPEQRTQVTHPYPEVI